MPVNDKEVQTLNLNGATAFESNSARKTEEKLRQLFKDNNLDVPRSFSEESQTFSHNTFFNSFNLKAIPHYNFWTSDEKTNDRERREDNTRSGTTIRKLEEIPRYVHLSWTPAPDLYTSSAIEQNGTDVNSSNADKIETTNSTTDVIVKGVPFSVSQFTNFSLANNTLADGYVSPGTIQGIVELNLGSVGLRENSSPADISSISSIDEDTFLSHPDTQGVSIHELKTSLSALTDGSSGANEISSDELSRSSVIDRNGFFDAKFNVQFSQKNEGSMFMQSADSLTPGVSIATKMLASENNNVKDHVMSLARRVTAPLSELNGKESAFTKVNFINPSVGGLVSESKANFMSTPEHVENMVATAQLLPSLELLSHSSLYRNRLPEGLPSRTSISRFDGIQYVGYVIEKYKGGTDGSFRLVEQIEIPDREFDSYIDCSIVYGAVYRYRIKAVLRWTRKENSVGELKVLGGSAYEFLKEDNSLEERKSSFFSTEWGYGWEYVFIIDTLPPEPPDELTVTPQSNFKHVLVTAKVPEDPQLDILGMRLFRKVQDHRGNDLTSWIQIGKDFLPKNNESSITNILYKDVDVEFFQNGGNRYVYAAQTLSKHDEVSPLSEQLAVKLNDDYLTYGEYPIEFVSQSGVKFEHVGAFSTHPFKRFRSELISQDGKFRISGRNSDGKSLMSDSVYIIRVESLDTGDKEDIRVNVAYSVKEPQTTVISNVYVPKT